ncbi:hypothetical protein [Pedococcus sp. 5OH_020]|uniref:hypothetical protein n=1 Tax=Pedococcus sp. 5OH_020 TaxID=2989814 RepID=UPI0022E9BF68|nr:hypothetical protein [Pedococcus sp. 5OH_020]
MKSLKITVVGAWCAILMFPTFLVGGILLSSGGASDLLAQTGKPGPAWLAAVASDSGFAAGAWLLILTGYLVMVAFALENQIRPIYSEQFLAVGRTPSSSPTSWRTSSAATASRCTAGATSGCWNFTIGDPGRTDLFDGRVYERGALTLQALPITVGDQAFFSILRNWAAGQRGGNVTTAQFVALAERISGQQPDALFQAWLYSPTKPPMPGAAGTTSAATGSAGAGSRRARTAFRSSRATGPKRGGGCTPSAPCARPPLLVATSVKAPFLEQRRSATAMCGPKGGPQPAPRACPRRPVMASANTVWSPLQC